MPEKRKDNRGRILKSGESQRRDLTYMYRFPDTYKNGDTFTPNHA